MTDPRAALEQAAYDLGRIADHIEQAAAAIPKPPNRRAVVSVEHREKVRAALGRVWAGWSERARVRAGAPADADLTLLFLVAQGWLAEQDRED